VADLEERLFGQPERSMGALEAIKEGFREGIKAFAPGLENAGAEIGKELYQMGAHGAHEFAAALFNGSAFVMYPRGTREDHGVHGPEAEKEVELTKDGPEQQRSMGRGM